MVLLSAVLVNRDFLPFFETSAGLQLLLVKRNELFTRSLRI